MKKLLLVLFFFPLVSLSQGLIPISKEEYNKIPSAKTDNTFGFTESSTPSSYSLEKYVPTVISQYSSNACTGFSILYYGLSTQYNSMLSITDPVDKIGHSFDPYFAYSIINDNASKSRDKCDATNTMIAVLDILKSKGFIDYFVILDDLLNNFVYKVGGATGAGRGSAGGSLVLFVLDITKIDPIRHNLIFERFLNPARIDPADVDLDIVSDTQKLCEGNLKEKFGTERVCHIANFGKFGAKTTVKDLCRIHELDFVLSNKLTGYFGEDPNSPIDVEIKNAFKIAQKKGEKDLMAFIKDNKELFLKVAPKMVGMVRQTGRHASGILVSNKDLDKSEIPLLRLKGEIVTGVQEGGDEREVSDLGYCKLDILGLKAASVINDTFKLIEKDHGIFGLEEEILKSDFDDKAVYDEFETGNCKDIFQFTIII